MGKVKNPQYKSDNLEFLREKSAEPGIEKLRGGVLLQRIMFSGCGTNGIELDTPNIGSIVNVHYTGRLLNGKVFDSTEGDPYPALFRVGELIEGWQIALQAMHEGETCRIWIPAALAYGGSKLPDIPAWSTLDFDLTLVKIAKL